MSLFLVVMWCFCVLSFTNSCFLTKKTFHQIHDDGDDDNDDDDDDEEEDITQFGLNMEEDTVW